MWPGRRRLTKRQDCRCLAAGPHDCGFGGRRGELGEVRRRGPAGLEPDRIVARSRATELSGFGTVESTGRLKGRGGGVGSACGEMTNRWAALTGDA